MNLFGNLFKGRKKQDKLSEEDSNMAALPALHFIGAAKDGDMARLTAAAQETTKCPSCLAEFRLAEGLRPVPERAGWLQVQCPKCGERGVLFGPKSE